MSFLPLDLKTLGVEKGGPGSGRKKEGGDKKGREEHSASLSAHGYKPNAGAYHHENGTSAVPTNTGTTMNYPSGATEQVPHSSKLGPVLDKIHGKLKKGLALVTEMMKGGPGTGRHASDSGKSKAVRDTLSSHGYTRMMSETTPVGGPVTHFSHPSGKIASVYPNYGGDKGNLHVEHYTSGGGGKKIFSSPKELKAHLDKFHGSKK
jgi:hypothetical protein